MSYNKHNFLPNAILKASQLNEMDNQIAENEKSATELKEDLSELETTLKTDNVDILKCEQKNLSGGIIVSSNEVIMTKPLKISEYLGKTINSTNPAHGVRIIYLSEAQSPSATGKNPYSPSDTVSEMSEKSWFRVLILCTANSVENANEVLDGCIYSNIPALNENFNAKNFEEKIESSVYAETKYIDISNFERKGISGGMMVDSDLWVSSQFLKVTDYDGCYVKSISETFPVRIGYFSSTSDIVAYAPKPYNTNVEISSEDANGRTYFRVMILVENTSIDDAAEKIDRLITTNIKEIQKKGTLSYFVDDFSSYKDIINKANANHRKILTWIDDDTGSGIANVKSVCDSLGIRCTFACITGEADSSKIETLKQYQSQGYHIANHAESNSLWNDGINHNKSDYYNGIMQANSFFVDNGFIQSYEYFVYPGSSFARENARTVIQAYCKCAVRADGRNGGVNVLNANGRWDIDRYFVTLTGRTAQHYTDILDSVGSEGAWVVFGTHSSMEGQFDATLMTQVLQYAISHGWEIMTLQQAFKFREKFYNLSEMGFID